MWIKGKRVSWGSIAYAVLLASVLTVWILDLMMREPRMDLRWYWVLPVLFIVSLTSMLWFFRENS